MKLAFARMQGAGNDFVVVEVGNGAHFGVPESSIGGVLVEHGGWGDFGPWQRLLIGVAAHERWFTGHEVQVSLPGSCCR